MANPFGKDAHGLASDGISLGLAPGARLGKPQAVQNGDDQVNARHRTDEDKADRLSPFGRATAGRLGRVG